MGLPGTEIFDVETKTKEKGLDARVDSIDVESICNIYEKPELLINQELTEQPFTKLHGTFPLPLSLFYSPEETL